MKKSKYATQCDWTLAQAAATNEVLSKTARTMDDMPVVTDSAGAKEVARLTAWSRSQEWALHPVMESLQFLKDMRDWDRPFLVADKVTYDWRTAPIKRYANFEDFYHQELEATWGDWESLQATYKRLVEGKITNEQALKEVKERAIHTYAEAGAMGGRGNKASDNITGFERGTSALYSRSRLRRDRPDLADRVKAGELSAHAAAIEAGFRTRTITVPLDPVRAVATLKRHFTVEQQQQIAEGLK